MREFSTDCACLRILNTEALRGRHSCGTERNLFNNFVAIFIPVPLPFPPFGAVVAGFESLTVPVIPIETRNHDSQHASAENKADDNLS